jgi:hypothetical protein
VNTTINDGDATRAVGSSTTKQKQIKQGLQTEGNLGRLSPELNKTVSKTIQVAAMERTVSNDTLRRLCILDVKYEKAFKVSSKDNSPLHS